MTYIALARYWRPRSFDDLLGQDLIKQTLTQALIQNRLHHAYLFTGTRGVGKTSLARLFAKALNCEQGVSATPCLSCHSCVAIEQGRFVDLIEVDGASKTKVEEIRDLLENVQYAPVVGRFKIYLIDEVHMLSQHSFNALLKTLEEPPAHVKFLLATTDPQKIPPTILSRCIQLNLKPIEKNIIGGHLETILRTESMQAEAGALDLIALAAQGSMRDALSILEQVTACASETISLSLVKSILGYTQLDYTYSILQALIKEDAEALFEVSHQIAAEGGLYRHVLDALLCAIHQLACSQQLPPNSPWRHCPATLLPLASAFDAQTLQLFYQITLKGLTDLTLAPSPAVGFEMTLIRLLAFQPAPVDLASMDSPATTSRGLTAGPSDVPSALDPAVKPREVVGLPQNDVETPREIVQAPQNVVEAPPIDWPQLIKTLSLSGLALHAAEQTEFVSLNHSTLTLHALITHRSLLTPNIIKQMETALSQALHLPIKLSLNFKEQLSNSPAQQKQRQQQEVQQNAMQSLQQDSTFQALKDQFGCEILRVDEVK